MNPPKSTHGTASSTVRSVRRPLPVVLLLLLFLLACAGEPAAQQPVVLATTTSTQDSGLLDVLLPVFTDDTGFEIRPIAVGSGAAIELGLRGEADVLLTHSPAAEQELVEVGVTGGRRPVMHNDFVIVGPAEDPASIGGGRDAPAALRAIAEAGATFVSRGDDSGTHAREQTLWDAAGGRPDWDGYIESGQGMGATLRLAAERRGYTLADRGTQVATAEEEGNDLIILVAEDEQLTNAYHVIPITRSAGSRVNEAGGAAFAEWITGDRAQSLIGAYEIHGTVLFTPDAR